MSKSKPSASRNRIRTFSGTCRILPVALSIAAATLLLPSFTQAQNNSQMILEKVELKVGQSFDAKISVGDKHSPKGKVYLKLAARIKARWKNGSQPGMDIYVNGIPLDKNRLVNKPESFPFGEFDVLWHVGGATWTVPYYEWTISKPPQDNIHLYVFDITSLLVNGDADLRVTDIFGADPDGRLEIREVEVIWHDDFPVVEIDAPQIVSPLAELRERASGYHKGAVVKMTCSTGFKSKLDGLLKPRTEFSQPYDYTVSAQGEMALSIGGEEYGILSQFGFADHGWVATTKNKSWSVFHADKNQIRMENEKAVIERTIVRKPSHLEIRDHIVSKMDSELAVGVINSIDIEKVSSLTEFRVCGELRPTFWANTRPGGVTPMYPVAYVARQSSGLALLLEDDAYRNQGSFLVYNSTLSACDDRFYLQPKGSYTFIWKIYPTTDRNYFTILNAIRKDYQLYQNIPGLLGFIYPNQSVDANLTTPEKLHEFFEKFGITVAGMLPAESGGEKGKQIVVYGNETPERIREANRSPLQIKKLADEAGVKNVRFLFYTDIHLLSILKEENWKENFDASLIRDEKGRLVPFFSGRVYCVLPKEGLPSAKRVETNFDLYFKELNYDGVFLDEWPHSRAEISFTPGHEDGFSAQIDKNFQIHRKFGYVAILTKEFQRRLIKKLKDQNPDMVIYANHFDVTREAAQWPIVHFAEPTQYNDIFLRAAQFGRTPLGLNTKYTNDLWNDAKEFLKQGVLMTFYSKRFEGDHLLRHIYPITVREIGPGYVIGEDKIVTHSSGAYSLNRKTPLEAMVFGGKYARLVRTVKNNTQAADGKTILNLELSEDEIAIVTESLGKSK